MSEYPNSKLFFPSAQTQAPFQAKTQAKIFQLNPAPTDRQGAEWGGRGPEADGEDPETEREGEQGREKARREGAQINGIFTKPDKKSFS